MTERRKTWHRDVFFGLHYDLHAGAKDTVLGAELTHEHLREELAKVAPDWVQCDCKGHPGYTSWPTKVGSTSPGVVKDSLRIHRDVTRELGLPLVMHYSGTYDVRACELHPEWEHIEPEGVPVEGNVVAGWTCNLSDYTDELMIPQMLEIVDNYDVDGFWIDGECWASRPCYCDRCLAQFKKETGISDPPKSSGEPNWDEWTAFHRRAFEQHVRKYADKVHARNADTLICSNWMYTGGHPSEIDVPVDYISGDFTHVWGAAFVQFEARFIESRGLDWDLMCWGFITGDQKMGGWTFKPVAHLNQEISTVIALGGAVSIYDNPQRTGRLTPWHQDTLADVARFARARQQWCQHTQSASEAAVLHCAAHYYSEAGPSLMLPGIPACEPAVGALHALLENHVSTDVMTEPTLMTRLSEYKLVVISEQTRTSPEFRMALKTYVENGGKVILSGTNVADDFPELAGVEPNGDPVDGDFRIQVEERSTTVAGLRRPVRTTAASVVRVVMNGNEPGHCDTDEPAITVNRIGEGMVLSIHSGLFRHFARTHYPHTRKLIGEMLEVLDVNFNIRMNAPARLQQVARKRDNQLIVHLLNFGSAHPNSPQQCVVEDVPPVGPVSISIKSETRPERVYLAPSFEGLSWTWKGGVVEIEITSVGIMDSVVLEY